MNRHPIFTIILTLSLLLSACVPIPATPPEPTAAETNAGLSDLASALAKIDESDDIQQYAHLMDEFVACMQADVFTEEDSPEYSESEMAAVSIFFGGMLSMAQFFSQAFEDAFTEDSAANDQSENEPSAYEMLEMALTACLQTEPE